METDERGAERRMYRLHEIMRILSRPEALDDITIDMVYAILRYQ